MDTRWKYFIKSFLRIFWIFLQGRFKMLKFLNIGTFRYYFDCYTTNCIKFHHSSYFMIGPRLKIKVFSFSKIHIRSFLEQLSFSLSYVTPKSKSHSGALSRRSLCAGLSKKYSDLHQINSFCQVWSLFIIRYDYLGVFIGLKIFYK